VGLDISVIQQVSLEVAFGNEREVTAREHTFVGPVICL
jgi:hypothetical protein